MSDCRTYELSESTSHTLWQLFWREWCYQILYLIRFLLLTFMLHILTINQQNQWFYLSNASWYLTFFWVWFYLHNMVNVGINSKYMKTGMKTMLKNISRMFERCVSGVVSCTRGRMRSRWPEVWDLCAVQLSGFTSAGKTSWNTCACTHFY